MSVPQLGEVREFHGTDYIGVQLVPAVGPQWVEKSEWDRRGWARPYLDVDRAVAALAEHTDVPPALAGGGRPEGKSRPNRVSPAARRGRVVRSPEAEQRVDPPAATIHRNGCTGVRQP